MNRHGNFQKDMPEDIEKNPGDNNARACEHNPPDPCESAARRRFFLQHRGETRSAQDAAFVFGNAFATKKTAAARTTRDRFARGMISTTLRD